MRRLRRRIVPFALIAGTVVTPAALASAGGASAAAWLPVQDLTLAASDLGFDAQGNAVAVGPGTGGPRVTTRPFGGSWSLASTIPVSGDSQVSSPRVAVDADGDAVAVWSARDAGSMQVVRISHRSAGGAWSIAGTLSAGPAKGDADSYAVALDDQGQATAAWIETVDGTFVVRAARGPFDGDWSTAERTTLSDGVAEEHADALQLAGAPGGRVIAAWIQRASGTAKLKSRRVVTGSWTSTPDTLDTASILAAPRIAANDHGDATAVWTTTSGGIQTVRSSRRTAIGAWVPASDLAPGRDPELAVDSHGTATAVWTSGASGSEVIWTSNRPGGSNSWSGPQILATSSSAGNVGSPRVAADRQRNVTAIWARHLAPNYTAQISRRTVDGDWATPVDLPLGPLNINALPTGGLDPQGHATLLWSGSPGAGTTSIFDPVAPELRDLVVPEVGVVGEPVSVSVAPFDLTAVTTTWGFGGASASGSTASHTYTAPGTYTVTVKGTDSAGNETQATRPITIVSPDTKGFPKPPDTSPGPKTDPKPTIKAPVLSGLQQTSVRWTTKKRRGSRVPVGTSFRFRLDRSAKVRLDFGQIVPGRRSGKSCVKATKANRRKRSCDRVEPRGSVNAFGKAGANGIEFRGKVGGRTLKPGRYRVQVTATADGKSSKPATKTFTIVR